MTFADWVIEQIAAPSAADGRRYLLLDLAAVHGSDHAARFERVGPAIDLLRQREPDWAEGAAPVLVDVTRLADDSPRLNILRYTLERCAYANFAALIESPLPHRELAETLKSRMEATLDDGLEVLLRLFDTRVLDALLGVLDGEQRSILFAHVSRWAYQHRDGSVMVVQPEASSPSDASTLVLDDSQQAALLAAAEPDAIIDLLHRNGSPALSRMAPHEQFARIRQALDSSRAYDIVDAPDQAAYCSLDLALGSDFHLAPPWSVLLHDVKEKRMTFAQVLERAAQTGDA